MILLITILRVVLAAMELGMQFVKVKFMVDRGDMVQVVMILEPEVNENSTALFESGKSEGKAMVSELPAGSGFLICIVIV